MPPPLRSLASLILIGAGLAPFCRAESPKGYQATKLTLPSTVLPSCLAVRADGTVFVGSMDGEILRLDDSDGDGLPDSYRPWAGSIPHWPLGMLAEEDGLLVSARSGLLRLQDRDGDGWSERWRVVTDSWDVTRDHHDWTTGIARWPGGGWVVSPVTDDVRARDVKGRHHQRGKALLVQPDGSTRVLADGLRYPTGWATRRDGLVVFTDNQGQQKTTCEINVLREGAWYGYPSQADDADARRRPVEAPAVRIPYPWARSVNGLAFAETGGKFGPLEGQLVLCEYNNRFILRASLEEVDGQVQGACYPFLDGLLGPVSLAFSPDGSLYVGSLREPAWGGEPEQGAIFRVRDTGRHALGIREIKALPDGFLVRWLAPADPTTASDPSRYAIRRYRHVFQGAYHSPATDEEFLRVSEAVPDPDGLSVRLILREPLIADRIYDIRTTLKDAGGQAARPAIGHYTMNRVPRVSEASQ